MKQRTQAQLKAASYCAPLAPGWAGAANDKRYSLKARPKKEEPVPDFRPLASSRSGTMCSNIRRFLVDLTLRRGVLPGVAEMARIFETREVSIRMARASMKTNGIIEVVCGQTGKEGGPDAWICRLTESDVVLRTIGAPEHWNLP